MSINIEKIYDLDYDEISAINVIESDDSLKTIFSEEVTLSFNVLRNLSVENKLNDKTKELIKNLFEKVILTKQSLFERYKTFLTEKNDVIENKQAVDVQKNESKVKLPKWYGKDKITKDIKNQNGVATNAQLTALAVNDLKNIYIRLNSRVIHDMLSGSPNLTDEEYREIRATITILKNKMKPIFKKKLG